MGIFSSLDSASGEKNNSITGRYKIERSTPLSQNDYSGITSQAFTHDPSFETQVATHGGETITLEGSEASYIAEELSTGDFHANMFDAYFINGKNTKDTKGLSQIFSDIFVGNDKTEVFPDLLAYADIVASHDSLCVRCAGIELPGYEIETKPVTHSGRTVQIRTNKVTSVRNGSISIRLDKNMVLLDLFSFMSGNNINQALSKAHRISLHEDETKNFGQLSEKEKTYYANSFSNIWQRWGLASTDNYSINDLGLCIVVVIRPPKKKLYSATGSSQLDRLNVQSTMADGGNHRYSKPNPNKSFEEKYPVFIFENIRILGASEVTLSNEPGDPPDITVDFIFRRFRKLFMTETELTENSSEQIKFEQNSIGTTVPKYIGDRSNLYGYQRPNAVKPFSQENKES